MTMPLVTLLRLDTFTTSSRLGFSCLTLRQQQVWQVALLMHIAQVAILPLELAVVRNKLIQGGLHVRGRRKGRCRRLKHPQRPRTRLLAHRHTKTISQWPERNPPPMQRWARMGQRLRREQSLQLPVRADGESERGRG